MDKVIEIKKLILPEEGVLVQIHRTKNITESGIIMPESAVQNLPVTGVVIAVHDKVTDLEEGDIILDIAQKSFATFNHMDNIYSIVHRALIRIAVKPDNYGREFK